MLNSVSHLNKGTPDREEGEVIMGKERKRDREGEEVIKATKEREERGVIGQSRTTDRREAEIKWIQVLVFEQCNALDLTLFEAPPLDCWLREGCSWIAKW